MNHVDRYLPYIFKTLHTLIVSCCYYHLVPCLTFREIATVTFGDSWSKIWCWQRHKSIMKQNLKQHVFHWISQGVQDLCGFAVEAVIRGSVTSPLATTLGSTGLWVGPGTVSQCSQAVGGTGVLLGDCWNAMNIMIMIFNIYILIINYCNPFQPL